MPARGGDVQGLGLGFGASSVGQRSATTGSEATWNGRRNHQRLLWNVSPPLVAARSAVKAGQLRSLADQENHVANDRSHV